MSLMKRHFFNNNNIPVKFSIFYLITGIIGIISIDKFFNIYFTQLSHIDSTKFMN